MLELLAAPTYCTRCGCAERRQAAWSCASPCTHSKAHLHALACCERAGWCGMPEGWGMLVCRLWRVENGMLGEGVLRRFSRDAGGQGDANWRVLGWPRGRGTRGRSRAGEGARAVAQFPKTARREGSGGSLQAVRFTQANRHMTEACSSVYVSLESFGCAGMPQAPLTPCQPCPCPPPAQHGHACTLHMASNATKAGREAYAPVRARTHTHPHTTCAPPHAQH